MSLPLQTLKMAAVRLHAYLVKNHWQAGALTGPDSGIRWNFRIGRFAKSYGSFVHWQDTYVFFQTQGYWMLANWLMSDLFSDNRFREIAAESAHYTVAAQRPEGYWEYPPLATRVGKVATVEGNIATIGLLESYCRTAHKPFLDAAEQWHGFLIDKIGFHENDGELAIHYFDDGQDGMVPNNTTLTLWTLGAFIHATQEERYVFPCSGLLSFLAAAQKDTGEFPYVVGNAREKAHPHFLCFQYNAFEFLDLLHYHRLTQDETVWPLLVGLSKFLSTGVLPAGPARYDCYRHRPEVPYYAAAVATALGQATQLGLGDFRAMVARSWNWVLAAQADDGGMGFFSRKNYGCLTDKRSYPRNLVMILYHLLLSTKAETAGDAHAPLCQ